MRLVGWRMLPLMMSLPQGARLPHLRDPFPLAWRVTANMTEGQARLWP